MVTDGASMVPDGGYAFPENRGFVDYIKYDLTI